MASHRQKTARHGEGGLLNYQRIIHHNRLEARMISATEASVLPTVPADVVAFAKEQGAVAYLPALLQMTRRIFPHAPMTVRLEGDPEIANDSHITVEVEVRGIEVSQMVACQNEWSTELFQHCPATRAHLFRIAMV
jgi:hypothetical protein